MKNEFDFNVPEEYEVVSHEYIDDIGCPGYILTHRKSGARVAVIPNDDKNKLFCISFYTPPNNSKGTPHIIEHTVLQGSDKYPAREPFMQLIKGSLHTFLNAMTYPDKTMYPVSSCNDTDFKNLMDVYLDAVFHPNLYKRKEIFMQEGWHYETDDDDNVTVNGVVYSEMKGASSSPDSNVYDEMMKALFPDTIYGHNSGGDPAEIPQLSYEEYLDFHRRYYHPSNSYIMLYGNVDAEERLKFLDREYLSSYDRRDRPPFPEKQPRFGKNNPAQRTVGYPLGKDEKTADKTYLAFCSLVSSVDDEVKTVAWDILGEVLVNDPAAPIKKALSDAGIGQEVFGGYIDHIAEPFFAVVAKNTNGSEKERFEKIIKDTLISLRGDGIGEKTLNAILGRSEFKFRESAYGSYPKGLDLIRMMLRGWIYNEKDPFRYIRMLRIYGELKDRIASGYFESLLDEIIESDHSALVTLSPEPGLDVKEDEELARKLKDFKDSLSVEELQTLKDDYRKLREYQEAPETPEEKACIPVLPRGSIPFEPEPIFNEETVIGGVPAVFHEIETNGIVYARLLFDISDIAPEELPYLDLLVELLGNCSTSSHDCKELIDDVRITTGGLDFDTETFRSYSDPDSFRPFVSVSLRVLSEKTEEAFSLLSEIITGTVLEDKQRVREVFGETVSSKSREIIYSGDQFASTRCLSYVDPMSVFTDMTEGIGSFRVQSRLYSSFDSKFDKIHDRIVGLYERIFDSSRLILSLAAPRETLKTIEKSVAALRDRLDRGNGVRSHAVYSPYGKLNEGFFCASQVQFASLASAVNVRNPAEKGICHLFSKIISNEILYPEIRVKGGAYGAYCSISPDSSKIVMTSYRDPNLSETLDVFSSVRERLVSLRPDDDKLWQLVIGTFSRIDRPLSVYQSMCRSMTFYLTKKSLNDAAAEREAILTVTPDSFIKDVEMLSPVKDNSTVCVIGGESKINSNGKSFRSVINIFD